MNGVAAQVLPLKKGLSRLLQLSLVLLAVLGAFGHRRRNHFSPLLSVFSAFAFMAVCFWM